MPYKDKEQQRLAQRNSYERNKEIAYERSKNKRLANRQWLIEQKKQPCADCNKEFPACVMDFHHRDRTQKLFSIGAGISLYGRQRIVEEISKCDLLCSNCHRIREYQGS